MEKQDLAAVLSNPEFLRYAMQQYSQLGAQKEKLINGKGGTPEQAAEYMHTELYTRDKSDEAEAGYSSGDHLQHTVGVERTELDEYQVQEDGCR